MGSRRGTTSGAALAAAVAVLAACSGKEPAAAPARDSATPAAVVSGQPSVAALPSGHPPIAGGMTGGHGGPPVGVGGLSWTAPAGWAEEKPSSGMRRAQYRVSGAGGDAECVVFYFGAGQGGDARSNAERWAGQFTRADGKPADVKMTALQGAPVDITMVEVQGTYHGGPTMNATSAPKPLPDSMLLGAIAKGPDANWFFKFTGPQKTVGPQRAAFEGMLRSLKTQ
jgi:hypothetical protein